MHKKIPKVIQKFTFFLLSICLIVPIGFAQVDMLSPKLNIVSPVLQNASQNLISKTELLDPQTKLPEWLNLEALEKIKGLKITKIVNKDQISTIDSDEGDEVFDSVRFELDFIAEDGLPKTGKITIWEYKRPEGAKMFLHKSNRYNLRVVTFIPGLPRGKAVKNFAELEKAGVGISLLWLLLAHDPNWQHKKAIIFNAETPSRKAFGNLNKQWPNLIFSALPYHAQGTNLPPLMHIGFESPKLTQT
ncbi:MAG: hypothetical protein ABIG64_06060 [Candidatus Omnitrophota bacterium]